MFPLLYLSVLWFFLFAYVLWQGRNLHYWRQLSRSGVRFLSDQLLSQTAILVPARNEEATIGGLLQDILGQSAGRATDEIVVINDHSDDQTVQVVSAFPKVRLLHVADYLAGRSCVAHKKAALTYGIAHTSADLLLCTDADCRWPLTLKAEMEAAYQAGYQFITAPVLTAEPSNRCEAFQALDMAAYMLLTAAYVARGKPILANGANMAFSRELFTSIEGYKGIDHLPSGDDVLLLQKVLDAGEDRITFLTSSAAVVNTQAMPSWRALWQQRLRWAGKTGAYTRPLLKRLQIFNFLVAQLIVLGLVLGVLWPLIALGSLLAWGVKGAVDYYLLRDVCVHYGRRHWLGAYSFTQLVQPFYLLAIGWATLLGHKSQWKGRKLNI